MGLIDATAREPIAIAISPGTGAAIASGPNDVETIPDRDVQSRAGELESAGVRWAWWSNDTARALLDRGITPTRSWDLSAAHRLLFGGWRTGPSEIWAATHGLDPSTIPVDEPLDLFTQAVDRGDLDRPVGGDGHLHPEWVDGAWSTSIEHVAEWARTAATIQRQQAERIAAVTERPRLTATVHSESAAEVICSELERDGLPFDRAVAESIIEGFVGVRPLDDAHARRLTRERDLLVLQHVPDGDSYDLRSPDQVKSMLRRVGIEVPDTRAWRLESLIDAHPVVRPLLAWRRAERMSTTFGYGWLDEHVAGDGRLRGRWSGSDGAAGRMTATAGLHNMPAELRPAVVADGGHVFVRADLGQIEPRILAAVSGDPVLCAATEAEDMYAPVAAQLGVTRDVAKVAVLGAMYGQTTGKGAEALHRLERTYPRAMEFLRAADEAAQGRNDLRTYGGRLVRMSSDRADAAADGSDSGARARAAARGRYGRNAMVQGAAAEFFKTWAALVRHRSQDLGARIVLCLHDELLVHVPERRGSALAQVMSGCLEEAGRRWAPDDAQVRFVADCAVIERWSDAK